MVDKQTKVDMKIWPIMRFPKIWIWKYNYYRW